MFLAESISPEYKNYNKEVYSDFINYQYPKYVIYIYTIINYMLCWSEIYLKIVCILNLN